MGTPPAARPRTPNRSLCWLFPKPRAGSFLCRLTLPALSTTADGFETELTKVLGIKYPIMCAGMGHVTGAELSAAVSNAGGIGTIGAIGMSPEGCRAEVQRLKKMLVPGDSIAGTVPFGLDLLLPQVGGNARKTNKDYTGGQLEERA